MRIVIYSILVVLLSSCTTAKSQVKYPVLTTAPVELSASIDKLSIQAMMGDGAAAAQLADYYMYEKNENPKWKYWALIGAEDGYPRMQFLTYNALRMSADPLSQRRAFYWLKKSAENGFSYSKLELKSCFPSGTFESHKPDCMGSNAR